MSKVIGSAKFEELIEALCTVDDPRVVSRSQHLLIDVLVVSVCAVMCGAEGISDIASFGRSKEAWLKKFLELPNGIPSHDTFARVLTLIDSVQLNEIFTQWVQSIIEGKLSGSISIDGKSSKGTERGFNNKHRPLHMVAVYSHEFGLTLTECESKSSGNAELSSAMACLDAIDIKGATVLVDAGFSRKSFASKVRDKKGHYIIPIKMNNKSSFNELLEHFDKHTGQSKSSKDIGHGRSEKRVCRVLSAQRLSEEFHNQWPDAQCVFVIERTREDEDKRYALQKRDADGKNYYEMNENLGGKKTVHSKVFYVSSKKLFPEEALVETRKHWGIENKLHWTLDVAFREDQWTVRAKKLARHLSLIRKIALNVIKSSKTSGSIRVRMKQAGWDNDFLHQLLFGT